MVDFKKLLGREKLAKITDPIAIFNNLDKESGKEYLRPPQESVLNEWHEKFRGRRDIIVKLHTGQGKTLIGLLMLQSSIKNGLGPAIYLCPNNYLVGQTVKQAHSFGIATVEFESNKPPRAFLNSDAILVTNCKKLFNGKSVFGVAGSGRQPINLGAIVVDDAHKCLDIIRESFSIRIDRTGPDGKGNPIYQELWALFEESLRRQAPGTCSDITDGEDCLQAIPFWTWHDKQKDVIKILSKYKDTDEDLPFVWDLIKDNIQQSICIFSGRGLEISPRLLPLELIPSFARVRRRIFLSATLTEDAFLVRDLGVEPDSVSSPLSSGDVSYSGERMIVMPTLVDTSLTREKVIHWVAQMAKNDGSFGTVAIAPSFVRADSWSKSGANITNVKSLNESMIQLKQKIRQKAAREVLVLVNEYDGVDLPDAMCRVLCLDSLPSYNSLVDRYLQDIRPGSGGIRRLMAQRVDQGMGRGIRGSSDWCIVIITGNDLTDFLSEHSKRRFLSKEAQMQIKIAEELTNEMRREGTGLGAIEKLAYQCLERDTGWKEYYKERMADLETEVSVKQHLDQAVLEREAETFYRQGHYQKAVDVLQKLVDMASDSTDRGWYLQVMATYMYPIDSTRSMDMQLRAHTENLSLFRPEVGVAYSKLPPVGASQSFQILEWVQGHESYNALLLEIMKVLDKLVFSSPSDSFEEGIDEIGRALGLSTQRPEKATGLGPDNLWRIGEKTYWVIECKNRVSGGRKNISKTEANQLNSDIGWFEERYEGSKAQYILIHPASVLAEDAYLNQPSWVLGESSLPQMRDKTMRFYNSLKDIPIKNLSADIVKQKLAENQLATDDLIGYLKRIEKHAIKR